ncbi:MAG TPA: zinc ribbon domain-containing protein [bacterium]|nr:zinc ribbon domain-containing protein [bacterium]HDP99679.1 zinc ribbon domain-containing protein [bacterium]
MPIYEYRCLNCDSSFEELILTSRHEQEVVCPGCQSAQISKMVSVFGFKSSSGLVDQGGGKQSCTSCSSKNCSNCG